MSATATIDGGRWADMSMAAFSMTARSSAAFNSCSRQFTEQTIFKFKYVFDNSPFRSVGYILSMKFQSVCSFSTSFSVSYPFLRILELAKNNQPFESENNSFGV